MKKLVLLILGAMLFTSCAQQISADVYGSRQAGEVSTTYTGVVKSVREVRVSGDRLQDNTMGLASGGIVGGVLGGALGGGKFAPTAVGVVAGAVTGSLIEQQAKQQNAFEYIVELDNGSLVTVIQGKDRIFGVGQPVYLSMSHSGRSHLSPRG